MWRAFFLAIGVALILLGLECMVIERAEIATSSDSHNSSTSYASIYDPVLIKSKRVIEPPDWCPWSLLAAGAVVTLYSTSLRGRVTDE